MCQNALFAIFLIIECEILTSGPVPNKVKKHVNKENPQTS